METSTLISVIYFCANIILLVFLSIYIILNGGHKGIKLLGKDVWALKKIYAPIIVHFYDCATDLGVVYYWYTLMKEEQNGVYDYDSVDMEVYFWCGITILILYRVAMILYVIIDHYNGYYMEFQWFDPLLVLFHLFVFKTVYLSYEENKNKIAKTIDTRKKSEDIQNTHTTPDQEAGSATATKTDVKELKIEVNESQFYALIIESLTESLPQIVLQSVFIIRSYNDDKLRTDDIWLLGISILASLMSISDKFVTFDEDKKEFDERANSPKFQSVSKGLCLNKETLLYSVRVLWRVSHIASGFAVYVLIWTVLGGVFLPIWCTVVLAIYFAIYVCAGDNVNEIGDLLNDNTLIPMTNMAATVDFNTASIYLLFAKWGQVVIGLTVIAIFATMKFECGICADSAQRTFDNEDESGFTNYRIAIFYGFGWMTFLMDILLMFVMKRCKIVNNL